MANIEVVKREQKPIFSDAELAQLVKYMSKTKPNSFCAAGYNLEESELDSKFVSKLCQRNFNPDAGEKNTMAISRSYNPLTGLNI